VTLTGIIWLFKIGLSLERAVVFGWVDHAGADLLTVVYQEVDNLSS
jgi:hypothetical protein